MYTCLIVVVPCHVWDDEKKKINTWDGSNTKSNTLDYLLSGGTKGKGPCQNKINRGLYRINDLANNWFLRPEETNQFQDR